MQVVTTALAVIRLDLGASIEALQWTMNAYNLSFAVLLLTGAALGDRFGRRRMFVAVSPCSLQPLLHARSARERELADRCARCSGGRCSARDAACHGTFERGIPTAGASKGAGMFSGLTGLALIAGPVVGGAIAEGIAWQWIFWIDIPIGLIADTAEFRAP